MIRNLLLVTFLVLNSIVLMAQIVPSSDENLPQIATFGKDASVRLGDDDYRQAFYFVIPEAVTKPFYIRVFDPEVGGVIDEKFGSFNSKTQFTVFGGASIYSGIDGQNAADYSESYIGDELASEVFGDDKEYDSVWYSFGPFNSREGEYVKSLEAYVFKVVAEGLSGDDGNLYNYFLSTSATENLAVSGGNTFTYEFTLRMNDNKSDVSHLYPFVDSDVISITLHTFDFDSDVDVALYSVDKFAEKAVVSGNGTWSRDVHIIVDKERESCLDVRLSNKGRNNNGVVFMTNQYGHHVPFMAVPIGEFSFAKDFEIK